MKKRELTPFVFYLDWRFGSVFNPQNDFSLGAIGLHVLVSCRSLRIGEDLVYDRNQLLLVEELLSSLDQFLAEKNFVGLFPVPESGARHL